MTIASDAEIVQAVKLKPIAEVAEELGLAPDEIEPYGAHKAKVRLEALTRWADDPDGKLIFVTAMTPTPLGEGKTLTTVGLGQALARLGKKSVICVREPSLAPVFGIKGGAELAETAFDLAAANDAPYTPLYPLDMPLAEKIEAIATRIYRAGAVRFDPGAARSLRSLTRLGYGELPACIAKTQASLSDAPKKLGAPEGFILNVREVYVYVSVEARFVVAIAGSIMQMPGLAKTPASAGMDVTADGKTRGCSRGSARTRAVVLWILSVGETSFIHYPVSKIDCHQASNHSGELHWDTEHTSICVVIFTP